MASKTVVRAPFNYDADAVSASVVIECVDESLADQSQLEDSDINVLVRRFGVTGQMPVIERLPMQSDFVRPMDYHTALNAIIAADDAFMELPADLRSRFDHDAGKFVAFCSDEANRDELIKLGLVPKPADPAAPVRVEVVSKAEPAA